MQKQLKHFDSAEIVKDPLAAWFLGPKAEHATIWGEMINYIFQDYVHWRRNYFLDDPIVVNRIKRREHDQWFDKLTSEVDSVLNQLKSHFPFFSPRYVAHMLSEQTLPSVLGYFAGMLYNPNNVTYEAAPITVPLELEVSKMVAKMLGYHPETSWAHITSGGTIANTEALWVARTAQFNPLIVQDYCKKEKIDFAIHVPQSQTEKDLINDLSYKELIALRPSEAVFMVRKLASYLVNDLGRNPEKQFEALNSFIQKSDFNVNNKGLYQILKKIQMEPIIYVSEAAHYSIKKVANLLGYGENAVQFIPVNSKFRMNTAVLQEMLFNQKDEHYTACVIGITGTTEEGAVDPIHEIQFIKEQLAIEKNRSFWLHVDAAWGGYFRSLFVEKESEIVPLKDLDSAAEELAKELNVSEEFSVLVKDVITHQSEKVTWNEPDIYKAFLSMPHADSITVDPHKMGYIPYPCGIIAFKNGVVTELVTQKAQYISDEKGGIYEIDKPIEIKAIGPYILEGSKPGAAAAAAWLAHKTIPLETFGHGKIIRTAVLNTRKFTKYLDLHATLFNEIEKKLFDNTALIKSPFTFKPIYDPSDTNVVCFVAVPMEWKENKLVPLKVSLKDLNKLNENLHARLTIKNYDHKKTPHAQEYFVSKTRIESHQYAATSVAELLQKFQIGEEEYLEEGIFVLRSTIMNPWYYMAEEVGKDYLMDFLLTMHSYTKTLLND